MMQKAMISYLPSLKGAFTNVDNVLAMIWGAVSNGVFLTTQFDFSNGFPSFDFDLTTIHGRLGWAAMFSFWVCMGVVTMHRKVSAARKDRSDADIAQAKAATVMKEELVKQTELQAKIDAHRKLSADAEIAIMMRDRMRARDR